MKEYWRSVGLFFIIILPLFGIHQVVFMIKKLQRLTQGFYYSLYELYLFLGALSILTLITTVKVHRKSPNQTGIAFLAAVFIKMVISYILILPVLKQETGDSRIETINFLSVFFVFLVAEIFITSRILNKKSPK